MSDSKDEATAIETELLKDYRFGQQQLIEIWGQACAITITKVCTPSATMTYFVVSLHFFASIFCFYFLLACLFFTVAMKWSREQGKLFSIQS